VRFWEALRKSLTEMSAAASPEGKIMSWDGGNKAFRSSEYCDRD